MDVRITALDGVVADGERKRFAVLLVSTNLGEANPMPGLLTKSRVLMFGSDEPLLQIRSRVLSTVGCDTHIVSTYTAAAVELSAGPAKPELVVLCHTADEDDGGKVRSLALQVGVPTYYVEKLTPPQKLVEDVRRLLKPNSWHAKAATH